MLLAQWFLLQVFALLLVAAIPRDVFKPPQQPLNHAAPADGWKLALNHEAEHSLNDGYEYFSDISLLSLHRLLVSIPSTSGSEHAIALFLRHFLRSNNLTVELQPVAPLEAPLYPHEPDQKQRYNVFAHPPPKRQTPLLLTSHIDTVPPHIPYSLHGTDSIWGRGTVDAKACVATQLSAYNSLVASGEIDAGEGLVSFLFVVGEEIGGDGMSTASKELGLHWETVIFGEPTELKLASGHKGILIFTIVAHGKGGHSGYPELGESAIDMLLPALAKLKEVSMPASEKYGNTTVNIGMIRAGVAANVIAQDAEANIGIRIAAGDPQTVKNIVVETVRGVDERLEVRFLSGQGYGPVDIDADVPGFDTITVNYGTDIPLLEGEHKRYLYGPGSILVAHSDHEHLEKQDLYDAVEGYKKLIRYTLGR